MRELKSVNGFSFVEMLVSLTILSILSVVVIPYAKYGIVRSKEMELRQSLRTIRQALDRFHDDCREGVISPRAQGVSRNCYPESLSLLVEGVESAKVGGTVHRYLRRIPRDPFHGAESDVEDHWEYRGYDDDYGSSIWSGRDVYDIRVKTDLLSLDGSEYSQW